MGTNDTENNELLEQQENVGFDVDKYREAFKQEFGVYPDEAKQQIEKVNQELTQAQINTVLTQLSDSWDVSASKAKQRLDAVIEQINKLPENERSKYDSVEGVVSFYNEMNQLKTPQVSSTPSTIFNSLGANPNTPSTKVNKTADYTKMAYNPDDIESVIAYQAAIFDSLESEGYEF